MLYSKYHYKFKVEKDLNLKLPISMPDFEHEYCSVKDGVVYVKKGYAWDGASGPVFNTKNTLVASLVHDVLYQAQRLNLIEHNSTNRKNADENFYELLKYFGVNPVRCKIWYLAVRFFGKKSTTKIQDNDKLLSTN